MKRFSPRLFAAGLAIGALGTAAVLAASAYAGPIHTSVASAAAPPQVGIRAESGQPVIDWNQILLSIVGTTPGNIQPTRNFAIVHAAIYDAVNAIDRSHEPYLIDVHAPRDASETAAADAAAHTALVGLYPSEQTVLDVDYASELAKVADGPAKDKGVKLGEQVATDLLAIRANDGSNVTPPPFVPGTAPGDFDPSLAQPPNFPNPVFTTWGHVTPFVLDSGNQFRPAPPPALTSHAYAAAINEVQSLGSATSTTRTPEQTEIGKFWSPPIQNFWNQIAEELAAAHHTNLPTTARLFAALNLSFADSAIGFYDAKYTYQLWRPVTAIRLAGTDGNPNTVADPNWVPLAGNTPADPSYPGAHSTISAAGAEVLASFFGDQQSFSVTSPAVPGVTRSFDSFRDAANEAGLSRIYAGVHTRLDHFAGLKLGRDVANFVLHNALLPNEKGHS
jgi:PAP2 superfamily